MAQEKNRGPVQCTPPKNTEKQVEFISIDLAHHSLTPEQFVRMRQKFVLAGSQLHRSDPADGEVVYFVRHHGFYRQIDNVRELLFVLARVVKGAPW